MDLLVIRQWARGDNPAFFSLFAGMGATMNDLADTRIVLCRYRYDALDRLAGVDSGTAEPVWRFYQKSRLSVEIQGAVRRSVFQMGDRLLAEHRLSGSADQSELLGTDRQRSVLHAQGSQGVQSTTYNPYGHCPPATALPGFNGERRDPVTGHYLLGNGYRAYNPVLMRFNQSDSLSPFGEGGLNAYAYCQGDPVNRRDPSGHISGFRGPGLFPSGLSRFESLPNEIHKHIISFTNAGTLKSLAGTSRRMEEAVYGLSKIPTVDLADTRIVQKVEDVMSGKALGVLPFNSLNSKNYMHEINHALVTQDSRLVSALENVRTHKEVLRGAARWQDDSDFLRFLDDRINDPSTSLARWNSLKQQRVRYRNVQSEEATIMKELSHLQYVANKVRSRLSTL